MSRDFRILAVSLILEENRMEVKAGRWDIYTQVPLISWFNLFCWLINTKRPSLHLAQPAGTSGMRGREMRVNTRGEDSVRRRALFRHHAPLVPLRLVASQSTLSSCQVVPAVQTSNKSTNA